MAYSDISSVATTAKQDTGNTSLASIDTKTPALGQAAMAASTPVVLASNQTSIPVAATLQASSAVVGHVIVDSAPTTAVTGPLTDTQLRATAVPTSLATLPALTAGTAVIGHVIVDSAPSTAVTNAGTFAVQASQATAASLNATVVQATPANLQVTATMAASQTIAVTQATAANLNATVTQQALTKGTQGSTGVTVQDLKDAGRSARTITLDGFAVAATSETLNTMSYSSDNGTLTTGTSYAVTTAKRLRIQQITASLHTITGNTTAVNVIVRIRVNNGGAALVSSPVQLVFAIPGNATVNGASGPFVIPIPDGWEFVAGAGIGVTTTCAGFVTTTAAPKVNITITGYEY